MASYMEIHHSDTGFTYSLKHASIHEHTDRMGFFVLFTNTAISAADILAIYRQKDVVEKAFMHSKNEMEPLYARSEIGTRARIFLSVLGYTMVKMIASECSLTYDETVKALSGIREVVYSNGHHAPAELTGEQKAIVEKLSIELQ